MKISMTLPTMAPCCDRAALLDWCRRIDAGPFESLAAGERVSFPNVEVGVALAAAAATTERVRIVSTLFVAPLHPAALSRSASRLDAGGRSLHVGIGAAAKRTTATGALRSRGATRGSTRSSAETDASRRRARRRAAPRPIVPALNLARLPIRRRLGCEAPRRARALGDGVRGFDLTPRRSSAASGRTRRVARRRSHRSARTARRFLVRTRSRRANEPRRLLRVATSPSSATRHTALAARCCAAGVASARTPAAAAIGAARRFLVPTSGRPTVAPWRRCSAEALARS
jgi:hypothetical protein